MCNHHEQACAIAAEGYARTAGTLGVAVVTSGPGGTNCITGVLGMWHDSVPGLFMSGQVRFDTTVASTGLPLRQLGDEEATSCGWSPRSPSTPCHRHDPQRCATRFEKALYLADVGSSGPVWLDVPLNVQAAADRPRRARGFRSRPSCRSCPTSPSSGREAGDPVRAGVGRRPRRYGASRRSGRLRVCATGRAAACGPVTSVLAEDAARRRALRRLRAAARPVILAGSGHSRGRRRESRSCACIDRPRRAGLRRLERARRSSGRIIRCTPADRAPSATAPATSPRRTPTCPAQSSAAG